MEQNKFTKAAGELVGPGYAKLANDSLNSAENSILDLLNQRNLPAEGWPDQLIRLMLDKIALMDSNNFHGNCGVGEREGRIFSRMVSDKNFSLAHGIGRSGDVNALQPKAIGSSLIVKLTKALALHVIRKLCGMSFIQDLIVLPFATGMSITFTLLTLKANMPDCEYVVWPRID
jgi:O-phospho-L-seryl-tRNASec:L-selenocysteinyl-tRNA synthase